MIKDNWEIILGTVFVIALLAGALWFLIWLQTGANEEYLAGEARFAEKVRSFPGLDMPMLDEYVGCVNSRFPLTANRWASVTPLGVMRELENGRLDLDGMNATHQSLGCGILQQASPQEDCKRRRTE